MVTFFKILGMISTLGMLLAVPLSIFFGFKAHGVQDPLLKIKLKHKALLWLFAPFVLFGFASFMMGFVSVI